MHVEAFAFHLVAEVETLIAAAVDDADFIEGEAHLHRWSRVFTEVIGTQRQLKGLVVAVQQEVHFFVQFFVGVDGEGTAGGRVGHGFQRRVPVFEVEMAEGDDVLIIKTRVPLGVMREQNQLGGDNEDLHDLNEQFERDSLLGAVLLAGIHEEVAKLASHAPFVVDRAIQGHTRRLKEVLMIVLGWRWMRIHLSEERKKNAHLYSTSEEK